MFRTSTTRARTLGMAAIVALAMMVPAAALARPPIGDDPPDPRSPPTTEPPTTEPPTTEPSPPPPPAPGPGPTLPPFQAAPHFVVQAIRFDAVNETGSRWGRLR